MIWLLVLPLQMINSQDLPLVCGGSRVRYAVKGLKNSTFRWEIQGATMIGNYNDSVDVEWDHSSGIHDITVTQFTSMGCMAEPVYGRVMVSAPAFDFEKEVDLCAGDTYTLKIPVSDYRSVEWNNGSNESSLVINNPGYYKAEITFPDGCKAADSTLVVVNPAPRFSLGNDTVVCGLSSVYIDPKLQGAFYLWSTGETSPSITVKAGTDLVWLKLTDDKGCSGVDSLFIRPCGAQAFAALIPNAFTPNGDNDNETWRIDALTAFPKASVTVYNRWGQLVYKANEGYPSEGWNGTSQGKPLPMDTYYYVIDLRNGEKAFTGSVNIIR